MSNSQEVDNSNLIVDALLKTDPDLYAAIDAPNSFKASLEKRGARVAYYRRYERGDHDADQTTQMRKMLRLKNNAAGLNEFNDNYCRIVVDKMSSRLHVSEITTQDDTADDWISETLERNRYESKEGEMFRGAIRDADSYVIVDPVTALWASEPAYDGFSGVVMIFDSMLGVPIWACKLWSMSDSGDLAEGEESNSGGTMRIVVYQRDTISFWKGAEDTAEVSPVKQKNGIVDKENFIPWPLGIIPVVHFVNMKDNYNLYGESELRVVIPPQNALNRTMHSMIMASEFSAFRIKWAIGMKIDLDGIVPGGVINMTLDSTELDENQINFLKAVQIGEFEESNMEQYTVQMDKLVKEISQISQTPIYGVTGSGVLSGDALKQLEIGLIGKVHRFQRENTDAVKQLLRITAEIQIEFNVKKSFLEKVGTSFVKIFGFISPTSPPDLSKLSISVNWKSPEIVDVSEQIKVFIEMHRDAPGLWSADWVREQIGSLLNMTQKQIAEEGAKAKDESDLNFQRITGGFGGPSVV